MAREFNPPPGWPTPPPGWEPPVGWQPDPSWPPPPPGWRLWVRKPVSRGCLWLLVLGFGAVGLVAAMAFAGRVMYPTRDSAHLQALVAAFGPVCSGETMPAAREFTSARPVPMIILDDLGAAGDETEGSLPDTWTADQIAVVVCAGPERDVKMSTCWYSGSDYSIVRYARVRTYRAIVARTGQVLVDDEIRAAADDCPSSVSQASGTDTWYGDLSGFATVREAVERAIG